MSDFQIPDTLPERSLYVLAEIALLVHGAYGSLFRTVRAAGAALSAIVPDYAADDNGREAVALHNALCDVLDTLAALTEGTGMDARQCADCGILFRGNSDWCSPDCG